MDHLQLDKYGETALTSLVLSWKIYMVKQVLIFIMSHGVVYHDHALRLYVVAMVQANSINSECVA